MTVDIGEPIEVVARPSGSSWASAFFFAVAAAIVIAIARTTSFRAGLLWVFVVILLVGASFYVARALASGPACIIATDGVEVFAFPGPARRARWADVADIDTYKPYRDQRRIVIRCKAPDGGAIPGDFWEKLEVKERDAGGNLEIIASMMRRVWQNWQSDQG